MNGEYLDDINKTKLELEDIKQWIVKNPTDSKNSYLISYAVVKGSGTIEQIFKRMIYDRISIDSTQEARCFLQNYILDSSSNPTTGNMAKVLEKTSKIWKEAFERKLKENGTNKSKLNLLVQRRNDFAHGSILYETIGSIVEDYEAGIEVLDLLYDTIYSRDV